jgi:hypothetical protein
MIDYLLRFPDPAAAVAAFPPPESEEGFAPPSWADPQGRGVMPVQVFRVLDPGDEETAPTLESAEGVWIAIATDQVDEEIWTHPAAVHETDREAAARGDNPILRTRFTAEQIALAWKVSPVWAGSDYGF